MFATSAAPTGWLPVATRAAVAIAAGLAVTFVSDHSAQFGLVVFGLFAAATGLAFAWVASLAAIAPTRIAYWVAAATAIGCAIAAFSGHGLGSLVAVLVGFAAVTGAIEIGVGLRTRRDGAHARDAVITGILSIVFTGALVLIPRDFAHAWETVAKEGGTVSGVVTADVVVVGMFGAYAVVLGVYLAIAAVSLRNTSSARQSDARELTRVSGEG